MNPHNFTLKFLAALLLVTASVSAGPITFFTTNGPDGLIATGSRPATIGKSEIETADDFVLGQSMSISGASFTGLLPAGAALSGVNRIEIEFYRVFPLDSTNPPSGNVSTRVNSPSDSEFQAFDSSTATLSFTTSILNANFTAANSVLNGINKSPNQLTGGEGPVSGQEVLFTITFATPFVLPAGHYFFRPEVGLTSGNFYWLSAPKPIVAPGTPFAPDLQTWIRNTNLSPDWSRIGTDITGQGPFNAAFSLDGTAVPEPSTLLFLSAGLCLLATAKRLRP